MKPSKEIVVPIWLGKLFCKIGWHEWCYMFREGDTIMLDDSNVSKDRWFCNRCGKKLK